MQLDFEKQGGLIPAVIQDAKSDKVLMLGYMNQEALEKTEKEGVVTFFSRSKQRLWTKGETSDNFLHVVEILKDCDEDTLLIKVNPAGPTCHTGADTCWNEVNAPGQAGWLNYLKAVIRERKNNPSEKSYTASLFEKGTNKIAQKVGEEAVELVIEAMDNNNDLFKGEAADLLFHYLVLLEQRGIDFDEIIDVLRKRHSK
ncbi:MULTISPECIES: bifunctional phosphoribosyl-AMP cyclohydrolase/phosphoribosyl-ATP diphosphatase HisIE [Flectobacillus]|uniref:Histidine biosynthesis bifunctional protein HisIE n=1 Tax=Flectobacillus roseus TaxID=502259 RepID=A0ABT6YA47_9BACT|nr:MULTISPECIES: bifunctional phosphoribosyl-AMP cyclohydrolase/phosphoribosyl-ATP diphosphatase HisIE [Flectobacillus]MDI9860352.1 bifunctional phosphoribosyl-AMP cyclohydrolase/phosphoribosyl-ATP diphosphatase HisIE [Flectobacillus roseus]MDI9871822.1 bifunctional phosphoribosyl-AMP cyclohydrolase/phosphoribosyl-ATP diphosphatase HisIE [Flectobacillus roseus]NBA76703.1 bifunctional phosphoribosyl-AMP cyclohydrolase/phosphoribosyl-ATP diphosphatase HisIE [Emticicia sp. ODNR4P]PAC28086.1 bifunc